MDLILISGVAITRILMLSHVRGSILSKSSITIWSFLMLEVSRHTFMYIFDVNYSVSLEFLNFEVIQPWGSNYIRALKIALGQ